MQRPNRAALLLGGKDLRVAELKLSGRAVEDIMVFAQTPCSPGWNKWRHGTCFGFLPAPKDGISDLTDMYLEVFGEPEPGRNPCTRDPRRASTGASPVQRRSGIGYLPGRPRKSASFRRLRALPKGRRTG